MQELVVKCTKIFITGWKDKDRIRLHMMNIHGMGLIMPKFMDMIFKTNPSITKKTIEIDDMMDIIINEHENIKITSIPNNKEVRLIIYDKAGNISLGITLLSMQKVEITDISKIEAKYGI